MREQSYKTLTALFSKGTAVVKNLTSVVKEELLAWLPESESQRKRVYQGAAAAGVFSAMALAFAASQTSPGIDVISGNFVAEALELNIQPSDIMRSAPLVSEDRVRRSDTLAALVGRLGIADSELQSFIKSDVNAQVLMQLKAGATVSALADVEGRVKWVRYWGLLDKGGESTRVVLIERKAGKLVSSIETVAFEKQMEVRNGEIKSSLYGATDAAGVPDAVANQMADIFSAQIDFHRDLKSGDKFRVVYENYVFKGEVLRPGRILAAEFNNGGKRHAAFWFSPAGSSGGYYTADGQSLKQGFLLSPLEFSRVTSGFTNARFHPVLQEWRAHRGVDYGAPEGTRVRATADAVVDFVGQQNGYGNVVVLRHQGKYTTWYAHLSGFGSEIRKGARVQQGDLVGFVGQTGWATGPHLHYEFRINDVQQNPLTVSLPGSAPLEGSLLGLFKRRSSDLTARMMTPTPRLARLD